MSSCFVAPWTVAQQGLLLSATWELSSQARIMEWITISFSRRSSQYRDHTCVSCINRQTLFHCATWEAHRHRYIDINIDMDVDTDMDTICILFLHTEVDILKTISLLQYSQFQFTYRAFILTLSLSVFVTIFSNSKKTVSHDP